MGTPFLSARVSVKRLLWSVALASVAVLTLWLFATADGGVGRLFAGIALIVFVAVASHLFGRRRGCAMIDPDQPRVSVELFTSRVSAIASLVFGCSLAAAGMFLLIKLSGMFLGVSVSCVMSAVFASWVVIGIFIAWSRALRPVVRLSSDGETVAVNRLLYRHRLPLKGLHVHRILDTQGQTVALRLRPDGSSGRSATLAPAGGERAVLDQLAEWLGQRGAVRSTVGRIVDGSYLRQYVQAAVEGSTIAVCMVIAPLACYITLFWFRWLTAGVTDLEQLSSVVVNAALCGLVLYALMRCWVWKSLSGGWLSRRKPKHSWRVLVTDPGGHSSFQDYGKTAVLAAEDDRIRLAFSRGCAIIDRSDITTVGPGSAWRRLLASGLRRMRCYPTRIDWTTSDGVSHSVLLTSEAGWTFGRDRKLDRDLRRALQSWRAGDHSCLRATRSPGPVLVAPLMTLAFLVVGLALPFIHNDLVYNKLRTLTWRPPAAIQPQGYPRPHVMTSMPPGAPAIATLPAFGGKQLQTWTFRPDTCAYSLLSAMPLLGTASTPEPSTHLLFGPEFLLMGMVPPGRRGSGGESPYQVLSLRDLCTSEAAIPTSIRDSYPGSFWSRSALFRDERFYYERAAEHGGRETGWVDLRTGAVHPPGMARETTSSRIQPIFFPDGRHVLDQWAVVDLDTGHQCNVILPESMQTRQIVWVARSTAVGDALRIVATSIPEHASGNVEARQDIWDISPASGRVDVVYTMSPRTSLCAIDGERWLMQQAGERKGDYTLLLHDHATSQTRRVDVKTTGTHYLLTGQNQMLTLNEEKGWSKTDLVFRP